jgi:hypothetical protein
VAGVLGGELSGRRALAVSAAGLLGVLAWTPFFVAFVPDQLATVWGFTARLTPRDLAELPVRLLLVELDVIPERLRRLGWALGALLALGMARGAVGALRRRASGERIALVCLLAPIAGAVGAMVVLPPSLVARYVIAAAPGAALLAGAGLVGRRRGLGAVAGTAAVLGCLAITLLHKTGNHREDFRSAVAEVVAAWEPGDRLFVATGAPAGFAESPVVYYLRDEPEVLAGLATWDEAAAWAGRLHVVHRRARYAEAEVAFLREKRELVDESPVRFRVQRLLFTSP